MFKPTSSSVVDLKDPIDKPLTPRGAHDLAIKSSHKKWWAFLLTVIFIGCILIGALFGTHVLPPQASVPSSASTNQAASVSSSNQAAAVSGTSVQSVSLFPPKGDNSSGSPKVVIYHSLRKNGFSLELNPATFSLTSDYMLFPNPSYVVVDRAADGANFVNMIACIISQLRIKDSFYDATINPTRKPYTALVDMGKCQKNNNGGESSLATWYVNSTGPVGLGDGIYKTTAVFELTMGGNGGSVTINMHVMLTNTIKNRTSILSQMFFESDGGIMSGGVLLDLTNPLLTKVSSMQNQSNEVNYFLTEFSPVTLAGSAITGGGSSSNNGGGGGGSQQVNYQLQFNTNAYRRKVVDGSDTCVDFRISKRILMADRYQLFNAADGCRVSINTGVVIQKTVAGFPQPLQVYIGYQDVWSMPARDDNGDMQSNTFKHFSNGDTVTKVDYGNSNSNIHYTLKKVNAKLTKTSKGSITLDQLKGVVLTVMNQAKNSQMSIQWDGTKLMQIGEQKQRCGKWQNGFTPIAVYNITNPSWDDCQCLNTSHIPATRRYSGSKTYDTSTQVIDYTWDTSTEFKPNAADFPWGMQVRTKSGSMWGNLEVQYEALQTLHLSKAHDFREGTVIRQGTVTGKVYTNTTTYLYGLTCAGTNQWDGGGHCFQYTSYQKDWNTCSHSKVQSVNTGSWLPKGVKLIQKDINGNPGATGYTADSASVGPGQGVPIVITNGIFNTHDTIFASLEYEETVNPWGQAISGNMTWAAVNSLETWPPVEINNRGSCTPDTYFIVNATGVDNAHIYGGSSEGGGGIQARLDWVWVDYQQPGDQCDQARLQFHVYPQGGSCTVLPTLKGKCSRRVENQGDSVTVLLDSVDRKFLPWQPISIDIQSQPSAGGPTYVNWVNNDRGQILPPTSATSFVYQTDEIVQADANNIHTLYCYDNCPNANTSDFNSCSSSTQPSMGRSSQPANPCYKPYPTKLDKFVGNGDSGSCSKKPTWMFSGIKGNPSINITWTVSKNSTGTGNLYGVKSIQVVDPGKICDPANDPTLTFHESVAGSCETLPNNWKLACRQGNDVSDFRQAHVYSFNAATGILTDVENNKPILITSMSGHDRLSKQYGPFFEPLSVTNKHELLCDYDKSEVCSWKIQQSDTLSFFNYETGPDATRVSLLSGTQVIKISKPLNLLYTHQGHTSNSGTDYDGSTLLFSYAGPDQLSGFPYLCLDANTYERVSYCIDTQSSDATISIPDITINKNVVLMDLTGTNYFYALPSILNEYYPKAENSSICNGLNLNNLPILPTFSEFFRHPSNVNQGIPSPTDLQGYLNNGLPVVVQGQTLAELAAAGNF